jgi:hypothetical protein
VVDGVFAGAVHHLDDLGQGLQLAASAARTHREYLVQVRLVPLGVPGADGHGVLDLFPVHETHVLARQHRGQGQAHRALGHALACGLGPVEPFGSDRAIQLICRLILANRTRFPSLGDDFCGAYGPCKPLATLSVRSDRRAPYILRPFALIASVYSTSRTNSSLPTAMLSVLFRNNEDGGKDKQAGIGFFGNRLSCSAGARCRHRSQRHRHRDCQQSGC